MAPRSRSRVSRLAEPAPEVTVEVAKSSKRERSVSRVPRVKVTVKPEAVIPEKIDAKKAAKSLFPSLPSLSDAPKLQYCIDVLGSLVVAYGSCWIVQDLKPVQTYISPLTIGRFGEKGQIFVALFVQFVLFYILPLFVGFKACSRLNTGVYHRAEMALRNVRETYGALGVAVLAAFVLQISPVVTYTWTVMSTIHSIGYVIFMVANQENGAEAFALCNVFSIAMIFVKYIQLKVVK